MLAVVEPYCMKWPAQGLRLHDNPALLEAAQGAEHLHALYVVDPAFLKPDRRDGSPTPRCRGQQAPPGRSPGAAPSPGPRGRGRGNPQGWPPPLPLPAGVACRPRQVAAGAQQPAHRAAWRATAPCRARDRAAATTRGRFRLSRPQRPRGGAPPEKPSASDSREGGSARPPSSPEGCSGLLGGRQPGGGGPTSPEGLERHPPLLRGGARALGGGA